MPQTTHLRWRETLYISRSSLSWNIIRLVDRSFMKCLIFWRHHKMVDSCISNVLRQRQVTVPATLTPQDVFYREVHLLSFFLTVCIWLCQCCVHYPCWVPCQGSEKCMCCVTMLCMLVYTVYTAFVFCFVYTKLFSNFWLLKDVTWTASLLLSLSNDKLFINVSQNNDIVY